MISMDPLTTTMGVYINHWYRHDGSHLNISTHWGRETHICVGKLTIIASDNGLSPGRRQAIIWTNAGILLIGPLGTNFNEILIEIHTFSFKKMHLKMSSVIWRPFCLGLNVLKTPHRKISQPLTPATFDTHLSLFGKSELAATKPRRQPNLGTIG